MTVIKCEGGVQIVTDLEATCFESRLDTRHGQNEIIEIGSVFCDQNFHPVAEFQTFVKPIRNPVLSEFCTKLTTITQEQVDSAPTFPLAMAMYLDFVNQTFGKSMDKIRWHSWGNYDKNQFEKDCAFWQLEYPLGPHVNAKNEVAKALGCRRMGAARMAEKLKIPFLGVHHRGIDDARVITQICRIGLGKESPKWSPPRKTLT